MNLFSMHSCARPFPWRRFCTAGLLSAGFLLAGAAQAATYYVSSSATGSTNQGTLENPWTSLATVNATTFSPGDRILLKRGDIWTGAPGLVATGSGAPGNPITYAAYGTGENPLIDLAGANVSGVNVSNRDWITVQDLTIRNAGTEPSNIAGLRGEVIHNITIERVTVANTSGPGILLRQGGNVVIDGCEVTGAGNGGIYCNGSDIEPLHDVVIQNCVVHDLDGNSDGITIHQASTPGKPGCGENFLIRNNLAYNCREQGFDITTGSFVLLENNVSRTNNQGGITIGHSASDVTVRYHRSEREPSANTASTVKIASPRVTIEYSTFIGSSFNKPLLVLQPTNDQGTPPVLDVVPEDVVIRNNVFLWNSTSSGAMFLHGNYSAQGISFPTPTERLTMQNNIWGNRSTGTWTMNFAEADRQPGYPGYVIDHNLYSQAGGTQWTVAGAAYDFATYQSTFGRDLNGLQGDPLFVDAVAGDFHLQSGSPAIDAGVDVGQGHDIEGSSVPRGTGRDLGAYEFGLPGPVVPTNLTATAVSPHEVQLAWSDNSSDETAFRIQRKTGEGGAYADTTPATVAANTVTFNDTSGVTGSTTYFYQVRAETTEGVSLWADEAAATTPEADTTAPEISSLTATPDHLWPANHKMVAVTLTATATDNKDPSPVTKILSVASSEAANGSGDGNAATDWAITGDLTLDLRAERAGNGLGRIYTITVQSTDNSGNSSTATVLIPVGHNNDTKAPTVALTAPASGAFVRGSVAFAATATDNNGVVGVQFKLDGANLDVEDSSAPYGITWNSTTASNGHHTLTAVVRDENGNMATAAPVTVFVDNAPPAVAVTAPASGGLLTSGITLSATATDNVAVAGVQFKLDGVAIGAELTAAPYTLTWDSATAADGSHAITAVARDTLGNTATSAAVAVTTDNLAPTVVLTAPADGALVGGSAVALTAIAGDLVGVAGVQFQVDGIDVGSEDTAAPYGVAWDSTGTVSGTHTLTAVARDGVDHTTTSVPITVTVDNVAPVVAVTAPSNGATVSGNSVSLTATASDNLAIVGVQFKLDGVNLGAEDTTAPYGVAWNSTTAANGTHALTAVARDTAGNTATAPAVSVNVNNLALPVTHQAESLTRSASGGDTLSLFSQPILSNGQAVRLNANAVGDWVQFTVNVAAAQAGLNNVKVQYHRNTFRAIGQLYVDGTPLGSPFDEFGSPASVIEVDAGSLNLGAGIHTFRFEVIGRNAASTSTDYQLAIDYIKLTPQ